MRYSSLAAFAVALFVTAPALYSAKTILPPQLTVGRNLQAAASIELGETAGTALEITLTSTDPAKLLFSLTPESSGSPAIKVNVAAGSRKSSEFYVQALGDAGIVRYTASAPGWEKTDGIVALEHSGIVIHGPGGFGAPMLAVLGSAGANLTVESGMLDTAGVFLSEQPVRGGYSVPVEISSSNEKAGTVTRTSIPGGASKATALFKPLGPGPARVTVVTPEGFATPAQHLAVTVIVRTLNMALTENVPIGQNLQVGGSLILGVPAPPGGLIATLVSSDAERLLLAPSPIEKGSKSITLVIPEGKTTTTFFLQALGKSGTAAYTASAPGFPDRTATVNLTPSGLLLGTANPPEEAELYHKAVADLEHGFVTTLKDHAPTVVRVYTAQLDPSHLRAADVTMQPLRPGVKLTVTLTSSDLKVGTIKSPVTIEPGSMTGETEFKALSAGTTQISVVTPPGFTTAGNSTVLKAIVKD